MTSSLHVHLARQKSPCQLVSPLVLLEFSAGSQEKPAIKEHAVRHDHNSIGMPMCHYHNSIGMPMCHCSASLDSHVKHGSYGSSVLLKADPSRVGRVSATVSKSLHPHVNNVIGSSHGWAHFVSLFQLLWNRPQWKRYICCVHI